MYWRFRPVKLAMAGVLAAGVTWLLSVIFELTGITGEQGLSGHGGVILFATVFTPFLGYFGVDFVKEREMNIKLYGQQADAMIRFMQVAEWYQFNIGRMAQLRAFLTHHRNPVKPPGSEEPRWGKISKLSYEQARDQFETLWNYSVKNPIDAAAAGIHAHFSKPVSEDVDAITGRTINLINYTPNVVTPDYESSRRYINVEVQQLHQAYEELIDKLRQELTKTRQNKNLRIEHNADSH